MRVVLLFCAVVAISGCKDRAALDAKDKEIAELKAKLQPPPARAPASLGAAQQPQPSLTPEHDEQPAAESEGSQALKMVVARVKAATADPIKLAALVEEASAPEVRKITYAHLKKNAVKYALSPYKFTGRILEVSEHDGTSTARVSTDYYGNNVFYVISLGESEFVQGDVVDVLGFLTGTHSYQSQAGWNITIPEMVALPFLKRGTLAKLTPKVKGARHDDDDE